MSFSIKTLLVSILAISLAIGWWIDHRKQQMEIDRLDQLPRHTTISSGHTYYEMVFENRRLNAAPEWTDFKGEPPVSLAQVSDISRQMLGELRSRARENGYDDVWVSQICLLPIANYEDRNVDTNPTSWCFAIDFQGALLPVKNGAIPVLTGNFKPPTPVYRAVVLMDGSIYSCVSPHMTGNADSYGLANSMLEVYPTSETIGIIYYKSQLARMLKQALGSDVTIYASGKSSSVPPKTPATGAGSKDSRSAAEALQREIMNRIKTSKCRRTSKPKS